MKSKDRDLEPSMTHTHSDCGGSGSSGGDTVLPDTGSDQLRAAGPLFVMGCLPAVPVPVPQVGQRVKARGRTERGQRAAAGNTFVHQRCRGRRRLPLCPRGRLA